MTNNITEFFRTLAMHAVWTMREEKWNPEQLQSIIVTANDVKVWWQALLWLEEYER